MVPRGPCRSGRRADAVAQSGDADHLGAVFATEEGAVLFESVTDDADAAVLAGGRQRVDRAFEAVEGVGGAVHAHLKRLVVIVSARLASGHGNLPLGFAPGRVGITRCRHRRFLRRRDAPRARPPKATAMTGSARPVGSAVTSRGG